MVFLYLHIHHCLGGIHPYSRGCLCPLPVSFLLLFLSFILIFFIYIYIYFYFIFIYFFWISSCSLPIVASNSCGPSNMSTRDNECVAYLMEAFRQSSHFTSRFKGDTLLPDFESSGRQKNSWLSWVRYFFRDYKTNQWNSSVYDKSVLAFREETCPFPLAAYLVMWLSRFIFPGSPIDGPSARMFSLAALLSRGSEIPLAPLFLGTLYRRLDETTLAMKESVGR